MIQPPPGVRATAEPDRGFAEQSVRVSEEFGSILNVARAAPAPDDADAAHDMRNERTLHRQRERRIAPPTHHDAVRQELITRGPVKATTAAATEEATSESEPAQSGNGPRRSPSAASPVSPPQQNAQPGGQSPAAQPDQPAPEAKGTGAGAEAARTASRESSGRAVAMRPIRPVASATTAHSSTTASASSRTAPTAAATTQSQPPTAARPLSGHSLRAGPARTPQSPVRPAPQQEPPETQFARGLAAALRQGGGMVTLHLKPEQLGDLKIRLQFHGGTVDARFEARTEEARALLNQSIDSLRAALEAKGLDVERLSVQLAERKEQHEAQDAPPRDAGDRHGGQGRGPAHRHAARTPHEAESAEPLYLPPALTELSASLGGAARLDAIA